MQKPRDVFKEYCKKNSMRYTPERDVIISEMYRTDGHFDIDSLFLRIRNRFPDVKLSKGSIYRNIPHLIKAGLIIQSLAVEGRTYYEHILGHNHHDHMECLKCGKIFEFYEESIDKTQQKTCERYNFQMVSHMHVISGYCAKCRKKK